MAKDYMNIGASPCGEDCVQLGSENYQARAQKECQAFVGQLERQFGEPPGNAMLIVKNFAHDFGMYLEVCAIFNDEESEEVEWAYKMEGETPEEWDEEALKELGR